ncbi:MAG: chalcone isomerase family protein [Hahellaceae bacterium]|nr:chalcone isomerase family protein [Hahellaceae bacterium]
MKSLRLFAFSLGLTLGTQLFAATLNDVELPDQVTLLDSGPSLTLNGVALRQTYMIVDTYVGGLYLQTPAQNEQVIFEAGEQRRMLFHVLLKKVTASKIARALKDALVVNLAKPDQQRLEPEINQFLAMFEGKLHKGDEVSIDYIPDLGTRVIIAGQSKGIIPGKEFADALLAIWIGKNPVEDSFKQHVLGLN